MNKTLLIIQREYLTRVKNKRFVLTTILMPLLIVVLIAGTTFLSIKGKDERKIAVIDQNGFFKGNIKSTKALAFEFPADVDTSNYLQK
jgi:ABC-2 type transport system permease protein